MTIHPTNLEADINVSAAVLPAKVRVQKVSLYRGGLKRALDTTVILLASALVAPLIAIMALCIVSDGHRPFYTQKRVGRNGRIFRMWKLRTMVPNADKMMAEYLSKNEAACLEWTATQKLKDDPRITRIGKLLRKTSLDELPQLWNVLKGDMALVGPRPMMVNQQELYHGAGYYRLRPGITGPWQISKRNECEFRDRVRFDDLYDRTLSLPTDIKIIARTFGVVLRGTGY